MSELASKLSDNFERAYVADEDGISRNRPQLDIVQEVCDEIPTWYEGGARFGSNVIDLLITGAERAVVGTATLAAFEELRKAFMLSENITLKVDYRDGIVSFDPSVAGRAFLDLSRDVRGVGIADIIVPNSLANEAAAAKRELGFCLGVFASVDERARLEALGADYVVAEDYGRLVTNE
ncbi:MAG: hypothetical protein A3K67_06455 [Euryarchaeota archaeon RBG_16_62_10]|nr:MAG: hypothetical protein A3K67_06455 [Euryarchaeota archaeon RBG_16_62_10]